MILESVEKDGLIEALYESSNIVASCYNKNQKDLTVTFKNGGNYTYQGVSETDYFRFETAESQGKVLNSNLKNYPTLKHESVDVNALIERIKNLKNKELDTILIGIEEKIILFTNDLHSINKKDYDFLEKRLDKISEMITVYKNLKNN